MTSSTALLVSWVTAQKQFNCYVNGITQSDFYKLLSKFMHFDSLQSLPICMVLSGNVAFGMLMSLITVLTVRLGAAAGLGYVNESGSLLSIKK